MKNYLKKKFPNFYNWKKVFTFAEIGAVMLIFMFAFIGFLLAFFG